MKERMKSIIKAALLLTATCAIVISGVLPGAFPDSLVKFAGYGFSIGLVVAAFAFGIFWRFRHDPASEPTNTTDAATRNGTWRDRFLPPKP